MAALLAVAANWPASPEEQLEAAVYRETVKGDLQGAMEAYRAILALPAKPAAVAARALFQLGRCLEKTGDTTQARDIYQRIGTQFAGEKEVADQARARLTVDDQAGGLPRNLRFEEGAVGKVPPGWFVPALPKDADYLAELRRAGCRSGIGCVVVLVPANAPRPFGNIMQSFTAAAYRGKTVRLRAWLRLEAADPDDRAQMWLSVDRTHRKTGFFDNGDAQPVRSAAWTPREIVTTIDRDAQFIDFGFMSIGRGRVWVDDVSFEILKN
jgi:tetratricopeptide (TPR) repeat protein